MLGFWVLMYLATWLAPITQRPAVSVAGFLYVIGMLALFAIAALAGSSGLVSKTRNGGAVMPRVLPSGHRDAVLRLLLVVGCTGGLLGLYAKLGAVDVLSLIGSAALRTERAQQLLDGAPVTSGWAGAAAFFTYPAGFVAVLVTVLNYEQCRASVRMLAALFIPIVFAQSIAAGGRSAILVLLIFIVLAIYLRHWRNQSAIPRARAVRFMFVALVLAFLVYSSVVWRVRSELAVMNIDAFLAHADQAWGVTPNQSLEAAAETFGGPGIVKNAMSTIFYATQSLAIIERVLAMESSPLLLGGYQVDLVAAVLRATPGGGEFLAHGYDELLEANVYGFFAGAWGSLYIDFGPLGCVFAVALWGFLAGRSQLALSRDPQSDNAAIYAFWLYSVLISFVSPPLGFSNSAITFLWFLIFHFATKPRKRRCAASGLAVQIA